MTRKGYHNRICTIMYTNCVVAPHQRRRWHPTPVLLPGKSHGWRSLVGCSPWGREESDTAERLHFHFSLSCTGEGNGNPPVFLPGESQGQGSLVGCRHGVAQSRTRLKQLNSSSSSSRVTPALQKTATTKNVFLGLSVRDLPYR